jgi:Ca2+/Na+ antiporter
VHNDGVFLMAVLGLLFLVGVTLMLWWGGAAYQTWEPGQTEDRDQPEPSSAEAPSPSLRGSALRYLRGVAVALVAGFWAGALVTGPAMRLVMRLLAVTAGDDAQGRLTEAEEVVGSIDLDGTISLYLFGGILPGLLSGAIYLLVRRWLPAGRAGGVAFGALHLIAGATRLDPLRPDNPDFDLVGPGWLSVTSFGLAALLHGMTVVAIANRFSSSFPPKAQDRATRARALLPLLLPVLMLIPGAFLLIPIVLGLVLAVAASRVNAAQRIARSRGFLVAGRVAIAVVALVLLPGAVLDLRDVISR